MYIFNFNTFFLLFCSVVAILCKSDPGSSARIGYDVIFSPRNHSRSHLHGRIPSDAQTRRPKRIQNREGGSRFLARTKKPKNNKKKLDRSSFLGLMGDDFKGSWMAYNEPRKIIKTIPPDEIRNLTAIRGSWATTELDRDMSRLNLTADLEMNAPELLPHEAAIRQYLVKRTLCPIEFSWKDLGNKYWPRWVRQGECINRDGLCSFPPGMLCVPGVSTIVHLLHWECSKEADRAYRSTYYDQNPYLAYQRPAPLELNRRGKAKKVDVYNPPRMETSVLYKKRVPPLPSAIHLPRRKKRCEWKKVPYLITIDCFCAC